MANETQPRMRNGAQAWAIIGAILGAVATFTTVILALAAIFQGQQEALEKRITKNEMSFEKQATKTEVSLKELINKNEIDTHRNLDKLDTKLQIEIEKLHENTKLELQALDTKLQIELTGVESRERLSATEKRRRLLELEGWQVEHALTIQSDSAQWERIKAIERAIHGRSFSIAVGEALGAGSE